MPRFLNAIYKIGINPVVDPPDSVMKIIFAQAGSPPVAVAEPDGFL